MSGYSDEYRKRYAAELKAAEDEQKARERENAAIRRRRLDTLESERLAERDRHAAQLEERLAPAKVRLPREWLASHPDKMPADFDTQAWPHLKTNLIDDERERLLQNEIAAQLQSRRYGI